MAAQIRKIAINCGGGYVPGLNAVVTGVVLAAAELGWEVVGIHDGYDGLLFRDRYPDGGLIELDARSVDRLAGSRDSIVGTAARSDPFRVRRIGADHLIEEADRSDELLGLIRAESIDAIISVVGASAITGTRALSVAWRLQRKGLATVCIPKSVENDVAATALSFGFNSALSYTVETLERVRAAARDVHRIAVVEVLGQNAGWLALQSALAACADAVLIPEIRYDLAKVAARLRALDAAGRRPALVVVAEGATSLSDDNPAGPGTAADCAVSAGIRGSLSPLSDPAFGEGQRVIERTGLVAEAVALRLQRLTDRETFPLALGQLVRGGVPTAVDRQLGLAYGAGAVRALHAGKDGVMVAFQPPSIAFVPIAEAVNRVRTVPPDSEFMLAARALGICLGD